MADPNASQSATACGETYATGRRQVDSEQNTGFYLGAIKTFAPSPPLGHWISMMQCRQLQSCCFWTLLLMVLLITTGENLFRFPLLSFARREMRCVPFGDLGTDTHVSMLGRISTLCFFLSSPHLDLVSVPLPLPPFSLLSSSHRLRLNLCCHVTSNCFPHPSPHVSLLARLSILTTHVTVNPNIIITCNIVNHNPAS